MSDSQITPDDLRYEWPPNILIYETRLTGGLTLNEILAAALPFMAGLALFKGSASFIMGVLFALIGFLAVKKFDQFGRRSLVTYIPMRIANARAKPNIDLPMIAPRDAAQESVALETWEQEVLMEAGAG